MSLVSKRREKDKDRISALPDALICHMLSFLPTIYAVRTTILSKRWNKLWYAVPALDFNDEEDFFCSKAGAYNSSRFEGFVDRVLFFRDSLDVQKFALAITATDDFSHVDAWLCTAIRRNVVEIDLELCRYQRFGEVGFFELPQSLFMCRTLVVLKLSSNCTIYAPPRSGCFPSLKFLHVTIHYSDKGSIENLISSCPVLEHLTIDGFLTGKVSNLRISVPMLKTLKVCLYPTNHDYNLSINAPKLENIDCQQDLCSNYSLKNLASLVKANIVLKEVPCRVVTLMEAISNVKFLCISANRLKDWYLPIFPKLTQLKLVLHHCYYWELISFLLRKTPNLEDLILEDETNLYGDYAKLQWKPPQFLRAYLRSNLKTITIKGFKGLEVEREVAKYLLENGKVLKKMTIYTDLLHITETELCKEFLMFQRGSTTCQVEIIRMS